MWMGQERLVYLYNIYIYTPPEYSRSSDMIVLRGYIFYLHGHLFRFMLQAAMEMTAKQTKAGDHSGGFGCVYIYNSTSGNTVYLYALTASCALLRLMISEEEFLARSLTSWPLGCLTWTSFRLQKVTHRPRPGHFKFSHRPRPGRWPRPRRFIHRPRRFSHRPRPRQFSLQPARPCQWMRF